MSWAGDFVAVNRKAISSAQAPFALPDLITTTIDLPYPVSTNRMLKRTRLGLGRHPDYKAWLADANAHGLMAKISRAPMIRGRFEAHIYVIPGENDLDNCIKPVLDWAQSCRLIRNDKLCARLTIELTDRAGAPYGCRLILREMCA